jgi:hypothetical protein
VRRLPAAGFVALAVATVAAVFITQHLKVTTPLIAGAFGPTPATLCPGDRTEVTFHLLHAADEIDVYVVDGADRIVRTLAANLPAGRKQPLQFFWDGHGVPPGAYRFRVRLIRQRRTIDPLINQTYDTPMTVRVRAGCR